MSNFIGANLLSNVQKKIFPNGVAVDIMQRLDEMTVFKEAPSSNIDAFKSRANSLEARTASMFGAYDFSDTTKIKELCNERGIQVKVNSVETKYIADEEQTGSVSVYTFTDRSGHQVVMNNINAKECIEQEKVAVDDILENFLNDINSGTIELEPYMLDTGEQQQAA